jgi:trafficking protein particle complex subunit 12
MWLLILLNSLADLLPSLLSPSVPASQSPTPLSPSKSPTRRSIVASEARDLSFLLQPQNFSPVPHPLLPQKAPERTYAALMQLVKNGQFNSAAVLSAQLITDLPDTSSAEIVFNLWYIRLASLTLIHQTNIAAAESKLLGDLTSPFYRDSASGAHIVPWHLRLLAVRLQALGFGEWRRGIMAFYILAEEVRREVNTALQREEKSDTKLWRNRLHELGISVASSLVEMGDLDAAARHLKTLQFNRDSIDSIQSKLVLIEALIYLRTGDINSASSCIKTLADKSTSGDLSDDENAAYIRKILNALIITCQGDHAATLNEWQALNDEYDSDPLIQHNAAVVALYTCDLDKSREGLESMVDSSDIPSFQSLLFNIATLYELSTENPQDMKKELVNRVSKNVTDGMTQEQSAVDFKLEVPTVEH